MERELWGRLYPAVRRLGSRRLSRRARYTAADVAAVLLWGVVWGRPVCWACDRRNWCGWAAGPPRLPAPSTVSRWRRHPAVRDLLAAAEEVWKPAAPPAPVVWVDAKPLPVGGGTTAPDATCGRAAGFLARGYKLHALAEASAGFLAWAVEPLGVDERPVAARLFGRLSGPGVVVGDGNYDAGHLYDAAAARGFQLVAPPRRVGRGHGHRPQSPHRHAGLRRAATAEGRALLAGRRGVERLFGQLVTPADGLGPLPAWVRGVRRVTDWVRGKMILFHLRRAIRRERHAAN